MEECNLIKKVLNGDTEAFKFLYRMHAQTAWNHAMYICANEMLAKDAVQNSFTNAFRFLKNFEAKSSFKTWLLTIVHNESRQIMKLETKFDWYDGVFEDVAITNIEVSVEQQMDAEIRKNWINKILANMKLRESLVLKMFYLQELKIKEIAVILGCKEGNVRVGLHRARLHFKELVEK